MFVLSHRCLPSISLLIMASVYQAFLCQGATFRQGGSHSV